MRENDWFRSTLLVYTVLSTPLLCHLYQVIHLLIIYVLQIRPPPLLQYNKKVEYELLGIKIKKGNKNSQNFIFNRGGSFKNI